MIRHAFEDVRDTGSADTLLARKKNFDTGVFENTCHRFIRRNEE
jgi:hypothetical protein